MNKTLENFYQAVSTFPVNSEVITLQVGHEADFIDDCAVLNLAFDFLNKIGKNMKEPLSKENMKEFSQYINAPMGNKTRRQKWRNLYIEKVGRIEFEDVGDINTVIFPVAYLNRFKTDQRLLSDMEERLKINKDPEIKDRIQRLTQLEVKKEEKLRKELPNGFYDQYLKPDDVQTYCYLRTLVLFYYNTVSPNDKKSSLRMEVNALSYLNFGYPNGNLDNQDEQTEQTFEQINEVASYLDKTQQKAFLEGLQLDMEQLQKKVEEERQLKSIATNGPGLLQDTKIETDKLSYAQISEHLLGMNDEAQQKFLADLGMTLEEFDQKLTMEKLEKESKEFEETLHVNTEVSEELNDNAV